MFTFTTATYTEQQATKAAVAGDTFTGVVSARAGSTKGNGTAGDYGINVNGVTYNAYDKVQDSASTNKATFLVQRDSTTLPNLIVGALNNNESESYTTVTTGQILLGLLGVGVTSSTAYDKFGEIDIVVGTGAVSGTSSPGKFIVKLTADGSNTPVEVFSIDSDGTAVFSGSVRFGSSVVTTLSVGDGAVGTPSITNTGDADTGFYFSAANTVDITTAGVNRVSVSSAGAVFSVGVTTPSLTLGATLLTPTGAELNRVAGVTSSIQTQLDDRVFVSGDTMTGAFGVVAGSVGSPGLYASGDTNTGVYFSAADTIDLTTAGTRRVTVGSNGKVGLGSSGTSAAVSVAMNIPITGAVVSYGLYIDTTVMSDVTTQGRAISSNLSTEAAAFTVDLYHFVARQNTIGAGSTVTNQAGFLATSTLTGATINYGFNSAIATAAGRWNFYASGTAPNYYAGDSIFAATTKAYLDGAGGVGGDTYLTESSANTLDIYAGGANAQKITAGDTQFGHPVRLKNYTVAGLPAAGTQGRVAYVTDALAPAFLTAVVGGGAIVTPVFDDGTNWVAF